MAPLEGAPPSRSALVDVAKQNDLLATRGEYNAACQVHTLSVVGFTNCTIKLPLGVPVIHGTNAASRVDIAVVNCDTASAIRSLMAYVEDPTKIAALNFANAYNVGGGYKTGASAQEEDLCRVMPMLYSQLKKLRYPLAGSSAHFTTTWLCRSPQYELVKPLKVNVISASMPDLSKRSEPLRKRVDSDEWRLAVTLRIRTVLHAALYMHMEHLVLGAFGCGAFQNPAKEVARIFHDELRSAEFVGAFSSVVFAIVDHHTQDDGNFHTFAREFGCDI